MFDVGDLVVCVDISTPNPNGTVPLSLAIGRHYRIKRFFQHPAGPAVEVTGASPRPGSPGFMAFRFRKIDAPDTEVSRLIRACKPVREGQPA